MKKTHEKTVPPLFLTLQKNQIKNQKITKKFKNSHHINNKKITKKIKNHKNKMQKNYKKIKRKIKISYTFFEVIHPSTLTPRPSFNLLLELKNSYEMHLHAPFPHIHSSLPAALITGKCKGSIKLQGY